MRGFNLYSYIPSEYRVFTVNGIKIVEGTTRDSSPFEHPRFRGFWPYSSGGFSSKLEAVRWLCERSSAITLAGNECRCWLTARNTHAARDGWAVRGAKIFLPRSFYDMSTGLLLREPCDKEW